MVLVYELYLSSLETLHIKLRCMLCALPYPTFPSRHHGHSTDCNNCILTLECTVPLDKPFQPLEIPQEAYYRGRAIVGVEGSVGNILNAAIWVGTISAKGWSGIKLGGK